MDPLAIAFTYPYSPSETFIRCHVENLAPGRTVALNFGALADGEFLDRALLEARSNNKNVFLRKFEGAITAFRTGSRFSVSYRSGRIAKNILTRNRVESVFVEYGNLALSVAPIVKSLGCKLSVQFHGFDLSSFVRLPGVMHEYRRLFDQVDRVIVGSNFLAKKAVEVGCPVEVIRVVPYGIDTDLFGRRPLQREPRRRFIAVGRLTPKKAPQLTIAAFRRVANEFPDATLDIIGEGELRGICESAITKYGLARSVKLHGAKDSIYISKLLADSDVFVQHSVTAEDGDVESFGISLVEAMATGIPVVTTDHNGFSDTISDGETGFLVPENDVEAMAEKMTLFLRHPELVTRFGEAGSRYARKKFDYRNTIPQLRKAIEYDL